MTDQTSRSEDETDTPTDAGSGVDVVKSDPIDAEFEPAAEQKGETRTLAPQAVTRVQAGALAAAAAVVGGFFGVVFDADPAEPQVEPVDLTPLEARLSTLESAGGANAASNALSTAIQRSLNTLRSDVTTMKSQVEALQANAGTGALADPAALTALEARLTTLEADVASVAQIADQSAEALAPILTDIADLSTRAEALDARLTTTGDSLLRVMQLSGLVDASAVPDGVEPDPIVGAAVLARAAAGPMPFAAPLNTARASVADDGALAAQWAALEAVADQGAPTVDALANQFDAAAAGTVRAASGEGGGVFERLSRGLTNVVTVAHDGAQASAAAPDIIARARRAVRQGDVTTALVELDGLAPVFAEDPELRDWRAAAERRRTIDDAVAAITRFARGEGDPSPEKTPTPEPETATDPDLAP